VRHSYKLPLFGHGPGDILMCISASLLVAATGLNAFSYSVQYIRTTAMSGEHSYHLSFIGHGTSHSLISIATRKIIEKRP